jgi:hypothetical protein
MEDDLKNVMRIIDKHADKMPDGDYLELCNTMRDIYQAESDNTAETISARSLFPEGIPLEDLDIDNESRLHFYTNYENMMRCMDVQIKEDEIKMLDKAIKKIKMLRRMTPNVVSDALKHHYEVHFIYLDDYTADTFEAMVGTKDQLINICKSYMEMENRFRSLFRRNLNMRCVKIAEEIDMIRQGFI